MGARTTNFALRILRDEGIEVHALSQMHQLIVVCNWRLMRTFALATLLNANANSLTPGGWSWELREQFIQQDGTRATHVQIFEAPPESARYGRPADPGEYPGN